MPNVTSLPSVSCYYKVHHHCPLKPNTSSISCENRCILHLKIKNAFFLGHITNYHFISIISWPHSVPFATYTSPCPSPWPHLLSLSEHSLQIFPLGPIKMKAKNIIIWQCHIRLLSDVDFRYYTFSVSGISRRQKVTRLLQCAYRAGHNDFASTSEYFHALLSPPPDSRRLLKGSWRRSGEDCRLPDTIAPQ